MSKFSPGDKVKFTAIVGNAVGPLAELAGREGVFRGEGDFEGGTVDFGEGVVWYIYDNEMEAAA